VLSAAEPNLSKDNGLTANPLVSIITPSYNQAEYLEETIRSVFGQTYSNLEYIVVDGGSSDGSREIIESYAEGLAWWFSEPDLGQTDAINKGFARSNGEVLAWLNSDDLYLPEAVAEAVDFLQTYPDVGLVYGDADYINQAGEVVGRFPARQASLARLQRGAVHIPQQASFFRADLWRQVGPLDPSFYFAMDYDLWVRLAALAPFRYVPRLWAQFRLHSTGKSIAEDALCWPEMMRVHWRNGGGWTSPIVARYLLRRLLAPAIQRRRSNLVN
jgi:glycosyltransferase involved in cell wall biosynthesis